MNTLVCLIVPSLANHGPVSRRRANSALCPLIASLSLGRKTKCADRWRQVRTAAWCVWLHNGHRPVSGHYSGPGCQTQHWFLAGCKCNSNDLSARGGVDRDNTPGVWGLKGVIVDYLFIYCSGRETHFGLEQHTWQLFYERSFQASFIRSSVDAEIQSKRPHRMLSLCKGSAIVDITTIIHRDCPERLTLSLY